MAHHPRKPERPIIGARVTPTEHARALANAEDRNTTVSAVVRYLLAEDGMFDPLDPPEPP